MKTVRIDTAPKGRLVMHADNGRLYGCIDDGYHWQLLEAAPQTWNGPDDGLPPVGMTVRIPKAVAHHHYVKRFAGREVLIVAHAADSQANAGRVAVFQCKMDDGFNEYHGLTADRGNFEPIRTAEQLAAEERERQINELADVIGHRNCRLSVIQATDAFNAGYRLVKP